MYPKDQLWKQKFPTVIGVLLCIFELILNLAILGCEIGGMFVHFPRMNVFVGYWTTPFFMCAWISLAGVSCCCKTRCCGIATVVFQSIAMTQALCVVGFDGYFLENPYLCFFSNNCLPYFSSSYTYDYYGLANNNTLFYVKVPLIKGQLTAGVLMFVSCVIYCVIFGVTAYRASQGNQIYGGPSVPPGYGVPPQQPPVNYYPIPPTNDYPSRPPPASSPINRPKNQMICPNCRSAYLIGHP